MATSPPAPPPDRREVRSCIPPSLLNATDDRARRHSAFARARDMRRRLTPQEAKLWAGLKRMRPEGYHWRRQAPFRGYWLDFVCFSRRVVVEADGSHHGGPVQSAHDAVRDGVLAREGFVTLRFQNRDIDRNLESVFAAIRDALGAAAPHPDRLRRSVPPQKGREE